MIQEGFSQDPNEEAQKFFNLVKKVEELLSPNCEKYSNFSFMVKLIHIKCINGWSNKTFNMLLELLKDVFPMCEKMPTSIYEVKKIVKGLGLYYKKIDACKNDYVIYYKENAQLSQCPVCGVSR